MGDKDGILAKFNIKDYRKELELILEEKNIDEEAQSLILSIFYKLDNFYKDYVWIKKDCKSKNDYIEDFINTIKLKCNRISVLTPQECEKNNKYTIDMQKGKIKSFPSENILFYAINELNEEFNSDENYSLKDFHNVCVNFVLEKGKTINSIEPLRDFNGWSWNPEINNSDNIIYNIVFQNMLILFGYDFVYKNIDNPNIVDVLKNRINNELFAESGYEFLECLFEICVDMYNNYSEENHEKCLQKRKSIDKKLDILQNKKAYINQKSQSNANLIKKIQKIDIVLNDVNLTEKVFKKTLKAGKTKCHTVSEFIDSIEKNREKLLKKIEKNNNLLSPKEYLKNYEEYKDLLNLYDSIKKDNKKVNTQGILAKLQKAFLKCERIKINKENNKKNMYSLARELRYYSNIPYNKSKKVSNQEKIKKELENVQKDLIDKMVENKVIDIGFRNKKTNYEILKYIFITKIIKLDSLTIKINPMKGNKIEVEYYDSKTLDYKEVFEVPSEQKNIIKRDKKIKLFKIGG